LDRLHAKLLWTPIGALVGSANFTNGGLLGNEELMLEATDPAVHGALEETARQFLGRSRPSEEHNLIRDLKQVDLSPQIIVSLASSAVMEPYPGLQQLLNNLAHFIH
jgi:phosphatidylserine/phosphatidylglycerophosphate/cardiolipin synthase-like enzyme